MWRRSRFKDGDADEEDEVGTSCLHKPSVSFHTGSAVAFLSLPLTDAPCRQKMTYGEQAEPVQLGEMRLRAATTVISSASPKSSDTDDEDEATMPDGRSGFGGGENCSATFRLKKLHFTFAGDCRCCDRFCSATSSSSVFARVRAWIVASL
jgi:hypothetical protein